MLGASFGSTYRKEIEVLTKESSLPMGGGVNA